MGAQWTSVSEAETVEQVRHDRRHPGKVCQTCPTEIAHRRSIEQRRTDRERREEWRMRRAAALVLVVLIGCWLLGSWLLGPS